MRRTLTAALATALLGACFPSAKDDDAATEPASDTALADTGVGDALGDIADPDALADTTLTDTATLGDIADPDATPDVAADTAITDTAVTDTATPGDTAESGAVSGFVTLGAAVLAGPRGRVVIAPWTPVGGLRGGL